MELYSRILFLFLLSGHFHPSYYSSFLSEYNIYLWTLGYYNLERWIKRQDCFEDYVWCFYLSIFTWNLFILTVFEFFKWYIIAGCYLILFRLTFFVSSWPCLLELMETCERIDIASWYLYYQSLFDLYYYCARERVRECACLHVRYIC